MNRQHDGHHQASKEETMQSNNPVFRNSEEFNRVGGGQMSDPSTWGTGLPGTPTQTSSAPMTIDSVVQKTGISLAVVIVTALATWVLTPEITTTSGNVSSIFAALTVGMLGAFALSMVNSFKKVISPALVLLFCAFEGVAMGALSKLFNSMFEGNIVMSAVIGTFAAFGGTLAVYKFFNIQVGTKFRTFVIAAMFGMVALSLMELVLGAFGSGTGLFGFGGLGTLTAIAGLVLGVFMLILDFDYVEKGVAAGIPERESWRAAFAMTVSLVWIYTNLLRLLAIFSQD
ncbi:MAG: Bax inhibitor-1/YccA family protein [Nocardioides sp.]|nr:Bax inhibitor-1/YccA family protein [Nocardioides sp.]